MAVRLFSGRPLKFVIATEDSGDDYAADVVESIVRFLALGERERLAASDRVFANYSAFLDATDIEPLEVDGASDIWRFVTPSEVRVDDDIVATRTSTSRWSANSGGSPSTACSSCSGAATVSFASASRMDT